MTSKLLEFNSLLFLQFIRLSFLTKYHSVSWTRVWISSAQKVQFKPRTG
ncbi:hypothetical protein BT93_L1082 [Corymbia citriodora subsp. variegata]|uniref:Uncharacterized protein n=1 Tax=Corymbia citriodora subsp. variegata TaxID=360336 RepID=A0A8T0CR22_CORYI|nr:hypothetical protein BT93_L1082 [Corymbia citriodora subsp. variegata]